MLESWCVGEVEARLKQALLQVRIELMVEGCKLGAENLCGTLLVLKLPKWPCRVGLSIGENESLNVKPANSLALHTCLHVSEFVEIRENEAIAGRTLLRTRGLASGYLAN